MNTTKFRPLALLGVGACLLAGSVLQSAHAGPTQKTDQPHGGPGGPGGPGRGMRFFQRMTEELNLTTAQKAKLQPIMKASMEKMRALRENTTLTDEQRREKFKALREERNKKVAAILTPAQKKKFAEIQAKMRQRMGGPGGGQGGFGGRGRGERRAPGAGV